MRKVKWTETAIKDIDHWKKIDNSKIKKIQQLIENINITPYSGIGKPEQLKYYLTGVWSRRITHEHRLIYSVTEDEITIYNCRFHYLKLL